MEGDGGGEVEEQEEMSWGSGEGGEKWKSRRW